MSLHTNARSRGERGFTALMTAISVSISLCALPCSTAHAEVQAYLEPSGSFVINLKGGSDTRIGIPLDREQVFQGQIQSADGNVITIAGNPGWTPSEFAPGVTDGETFQVLFQTGLEEGMALRILNNGSNTLEVELGVESLDFVATNQFDGEGDIIRIVPCHTPSSLFGNVDLPDGTLIFLYDNIRQGVNKSPSEVLTYFAGYGWLDAEFAPADNFPLERGEHIGIRLPAGPDLEVTVDGLVPYIADRYHIVHSRNDLQLDYHFSVTDPLGVPISQAGFDLVDGTLVAVYDNSRAGYNKGPGQIITYFENVGWLDSQFEFVDETFILEPGVGYMLRLPAEPEATDYIISRPPSYISEP